MPNRFLTTIDLLRNKFRDLLQFSRLASLFFILAASVFATSHQMDDATTLATEPADAQLVESVARNVAAAIIQATPIRPNLSLRSVQSPSDAFGSSAMTSLSSTPTPIAVSPVMMSPLPTPMIGSAFSQADIAAIVSVLDKPVGDTPRFGSSVLLPFIVASVSGAAEKVVTEKTAITSPEPAHSRRGYPPSLAAVVVPLRFPRSGPTPFPAVQSIVLPRTTQQIPADGVNRTVTVPILMYHYLSVPPPDADIYRLDLSVTPNLFAAHLDRLLAEGYQTISLYALFEHLANGTQLPEKPVVLTFDDGYRDNYANAFPRLVARGMTATFFIVTGFIDDNSPRYITWDMAREMFAAGMSMESHSINHFSLKGRDDDFLIWQALNTAETIELQLGIRPRFIAYPAGEYDWRTIEIFRSANYWAGVTTKPGATHSNDNLFELRRVRIRGTTSADDLSQLLQTE